VVYEDQGPPFTLEAGDCVLQPPHIRHRVLECSAGLEVIELSSPASHETLVEHDLSLPTPDRAPDREFGGQRFARHIAAAAAWQPWRAAGFEARDLGIAAASAGLADVRVIRRRVGIAPPAPLCRHDAELLFTFVLRGSVALVRDWRPRPGPESAPDLDVHTLAAGDAFAVPAHEPHRLVDCSADMELLQIALPAGYTATHG